MPRMLRYALNNRLFSEKMNTSGSMTDVTPDAYATVDQLSAAITEATTATLATMNDTAATKEELSEAVADVLAAVNDSAITTEEVMADG